MHAAATRKQSRSPLLSQIDAWEATYFCQFQQFFEFIGAGFELIECCKYRLPNQYQPILATTTASGMPSEVRRRGHIEQPHATHPE